LIGLNISGLLFMGGYNRNNMFDLRLDYPKLTRDLIELLIKGSRAAVLLIPHVFGTQDSESDQQISEKLFEELQTFYPRDLGIICGRYNQNEVKSVIGQCDFFIGSRMHACIGAVSQSIPTLCVAYSDKFIGVMETVGIPSIVADARKLTADEILKLVGHCFTNRAAVREELQRNMPNVISAAIRLFSDTRECQDIYSTPCVSRGV